MDRPRVKIAPEMAPRKNPFKAIMKSLGRVDRRTRTLLVEAQQWRAVATDLNVNSALIADPQIKASLCALAGQYERMARGAEERYAAHLRKLESATILTQRLYQYAVSLELKEKVGSIWWCNRQRQ